MDFHTCTAVVTGGASGLGRLVSERLAALGAHVFVVDRDAEACTETSAAIAAAGGSADAEAIDVCDDHELAALVARASRPGRPLRIWVNNAGGWGTGSQQFPDSPVDEWSAVLALNLRAPMLAVQLARAAMRPDGGAIVNVSSSAAIGDAPYGSPEYAATKAALIRLTTSLGGLGATEGLRVSCVVPGWIGLPRAHEQFAELTPAEQLAAGRLIPPDEVVSAITGLIERRDSAGTVVVLD